MNMNQSFRHLFFGFNGLLFIVILSPFLSAWFVPDKLDGIVIETAEVVVEECACMCDPASDRDALIAVYNNSTNGENRANNLTNLTKLKF